MMKKRLSWIAAVLALSVSSAWAQEPLTKAEETEAMLGMDHGQMDHGKMDHGSAPPPTAAAEGDTGKAASMDHGSMQGGSAPPDARDPHAYSGGYTLDPARPLRLADEHNFGSLLADQFEVARARDNTSAAYELQAWYGRTYDRAVLKAEGEVDGGKFEEARTELLWGHAVAPFWDAQLGVRYDSGVGPNRRWLAFGIQGLAPYWFEVDAAIYIGDEGRTALRLDAEYELLLTQKLILQPKIETDFYGKRDAERGLGSGLAKLTAAVRLRYEIRREFAPYVGIERARKFGATAGYARAAGKDTEETRLVAGVRFWF
ncbi:MAG: copper resistance protein B [Nitrospirota bacterium]